MPNTTCTTSLSPPAATPLLTLSRSITNHGSTLYVRTNKDASQYKVITIDLAKKNEVKDLILETDAFLSDVSSVNKDNLAIIYKRNVGSCNLCYHLLPDTQGRSKTRFMSTQETETGSFVWRRNSLVLPQFPLAKSNPGFSLQ